MRTIRTRSRWLSGKAGIHFWRLQEDRLAPIPAVESKAFDKGSHSFKRLAQNDSDFSQVLLPGCFDRVLEIPTVG